MGGYATRERTVDCGALYESLRRGLIEMVSGIDGSALESIVPATPDWRVRDVVAHVTGIAEDLNAGDFGHGDSDAFTRAQVVRHARSSLAQLVTAWDREAPQFEEGLRLLGYQIGNHFVGDLFIHAVDVAAALGRPIDRDTLAVWVSLDWYLDSLEQFLLDAEAPGALEVITEPERRVVGDGDVVARVRAPAFDIVRACAGRRSAAQIAAYGWTGESEWFIPRLSRYSTPTADGVD